MFSKVAQTIHPDRSEMPLPREINIRVGDKPLLKYNESLKLEGKILSFQGDRIVTEPWTQSSRGSFQGDLRRPRQVKIKIKCPEGWREIDTRFDSTRWKNNFPCDVLYCLQQPEVGHYKGTLDIVAMTMDVRGRAGRESGILIRVGSEE